MMRLLAFCNEYDISKDTLAVQFSQGRLSPKIYIHTDTGVFIDDDLLKSLYAKRVKIRFFIQDMLYVLLEHMSATDVARLIMCDCERGNEVSWALFFRDIYGLIKNIMRYDILDREKQAYFALKKIDRYLQKRYKGYSVSDILDKRMNKSS